MEKNELFTEAALSDTVIYKSFNNNAEMTSTILSLLKDSMIIDESYIKEQIMQIRRTRISPLAEEVLKAYQDGDILIMYARTLKVPSMLPFFITKMQGKYKAIVFANTYGTISTSEVNSEEKYLNIPMKELYVLLEGAYTDYQYTMYPIKVTKTLGLMKLSTWIYSTMFNRILIKEYALSMDIDLTNKVSYVVSRFFLEKVWGSKNEELNNSYSLSSINPGRNKGINVADFTLIMDQYDASNIENINDLINFLSQLSPRLKGLNFRYFLQRYITTYKAQTMFGLECLPYFLFTVQATLLGSFIVQSPSISDIIKNIPGMNIFYPELVKALS